MSTAASWINGRRYVAAWRRRFALAFLVAASAAMPKAPLSGQTFERLPELATVDAQVRHASSFDEASVLVPRVAPRVETREDQSPSSDQTASDQVSLDELLRRLRATEERLAEMESLRPAGWTAGWAVDIGQQTRRSATRNSSTPLD